MWIGFPNRRWRHNTFTVACLAALLALGTVGCGKDKKKEQVFEPFHCEPDAFATAQQSTLVDDWHNRMVYRAATAETGPFDEIQIRSYFDDPRAATAPGRIDLTDTTPADCGLCLYAFRNCVGDECEKMYFADMGAVVVSSVGEVGESFSGYFNNVIFRELWYDSGEFKFLEGGETWCAHDFQFSSTIEQKMAWPTCVPEGTGAMLGDNIADYTLQNCNGDMVDLHSRCGTTKAVWMMMIAGWCSACGSAVPDAASQYNNLSAQGLDLMVVMGDGPERNTTPTLDYCTQYANQHGIDPSQVFLDDNWQKTFMNIYPYLGDSIYLPWNAVLRGANLEYVYNDSFGGGSVSKTVNSLLSE